MSDRLRSVVILIVVVVWALNITVPIFVKDYKAIPELNAAFMGMVGLIIAGKKGGEGEDNTGTNDSAPRNELEERRTARTPGDHDSA